MKINIKLFNTIFYFINLNFILDVPNSGTKLMNLQKRLDWNKAFNEHVIKLDNKKPVIICGDMNVAHQEIGEIIKFNNRT